MYSPKTLPTDMARIHIGTSGFYYSNWVKEFYPEDLKKDEWLHFYSTKFNTVELNNTFYHVPRTTSVEKWKASVDDEFVFTLKVSQEITHNPEFEFQREVLDKFINSLQILINKKVNHILLFQLPHSTRQNIFNLQKLLEALPKDFRYAFEFRNKSWFETDVLSLLKDHNAAIVFSDSPLKYSGEPSWPRVDFETADFAYFRLHGSKRLYESSYTDEELGQYRDMIKDKLERNIDIILYFNNTRLVHAVENGFTLKKFLDNSTLKPE